MSRRPSTATDTVVDHTLVGLLFGARCAIDEGRRARRRVEVGLDRVPARANPAPLDRAEPARLPALL